MKNCTGIILAGGQSLRMGTDKAFVVYQSKPLIQHALDLFTPLCNEVIISGNSPKLAEFKVPVVADQFSQSGPLSGVYSACKAAKNDVCIIVPCDVPHVSQQLFTTLYNHLENYDAVVPRLSNGYVEPLIACFKTNIHTKIASFLESKQYKAQDFLNTISVKYIDIADEQQFRNINSGSDIQ